MPPFSRVWYTGLISSECGIKIAVPNWCKLPPSREIGTHSGAKLSWCCPLWLLWRGWHRLLFRHTLPPARELPKLHAQTLWGREFEIEQEEESGKLLLLCIAYGSLWQSSISDGVLEANLLFDVQGCDWKGQDTPKAGKCVECSMCQHECQTEWCSKPQESKAVLLLQKPSSFNSLEMSRTVGP